MSICLRNGIKVSPEIQGYRFSIVVDNNGALVYGKKTFNSKEIANAVSKTYKYYAKLILNKKENAKVS